MTRLFALCAVFTASIGLEYLRKLSAENAGVLSERMHKGRKSRFSVDIRATGVNFKQDKLDYCQ